MRLLKPNNSGGFSLTEDLVGDRIPQYAILSHRWGPEEVTFRDLKDEPGLRDLQNGARPSKHGYDKIQFCGNQAQRDGLVHFWVDTCCIDKSSSAELTKSINSMFKWYRNAARCYVYLDDVSKPTLQTGDESNDPLWGTGFRDSQWFRRGWTLQELLAPASVEFFSREGARLGTKRSLELPISDITGIPVKVLRGFPLPDCTVPERFAWAESRQTTEDED
ncbi:Uu.00g130450.m01.CDS01 [Anthostomella pinea]|uniref:Uu.00g130450.m01.CDS01 n=1 Tax=Anthostomella pinea TaxID=933095 RepID=A0AAI8VJE9_9PEZI|nr:Uu.00g130450.m01.CDS01 [Anthostomella pinea]